MDTPDILTRPLASAAQPIRSIRLGSGRRTSVRLEPEFWEALQVIAALRGQSINHLVGLLARQQPDNLSSAIRVFTLRYFRRKAAGGFGQWNTELDL